jgi:hypothetical protein
MDQSRLQPRVFVNLNQRNEIMQFKSAVSNPASRAHVLLSPDASNPSEQTIDDKTSNIARISHCTPASKLSASVTRHDNSTVPACMAETRHTCKSS